MSEQQQKNCFDKEKNEVLLEHSFIEPGGFSPWISTKANWLVILIN